jgi:uncharacterized glyoxalase superfamily protein PhnB
MSEPAVKPVPEGTHTLTPHLVCANAYDAIEFYKKAFGAVEMFRMPGPDGKLMHASMRIGDSNLMLAEERPQWNSFGPKALKGSSVTIHMAVPNVDELFAQAVAAGATVILPVSDMFWGDRYGQVEDPFGHRWAIATRKRDLSPAEMQAAMKTGM